MPGREKLETAMPKGRWFERCKATLPDTSEAAETRGGSFWAIQVYLAAKIMNGI